MTLQLPISFFDYATQHHPDTLWTALTLFLGPAELQDLCDSGVVVPERPELRPLCSEELNRKLSEMRRKALDLFPQYRLSGLPSLEEVEALGPSKDREVHRLYVALLAIQHQEQALKSNQRAYELAVQCRKEFFETAHSYWSALQGLAAFTAFGRHAYAMTADLQREFSEAPLPSELSWGDFRLPRPAIWVSLPDSGMQLYGGEDVDFLSLNGALVFSMRAACELRPDLVEPSVSAMLEEEGDAICVLLWAQPRSVTKGGGMQDAVARFMLPVSGILRLHEALETLQSQDITPDEVLLKDRVESLLDSAHANYMWQDDKARGNAAVLARVVRMILYMLLHLNMRNKWIRESRLDLAKEREELLKKADKQREHKARKTRRRADRLPRINYLVLDAPPEAKAARAASPRAKYGAAPHWRSQHLRRVWSGPRKDADGNPQKGTSYEWKTIPGGWVAGHGTRKKEAPRSTLTVLRKKNS